MGEIKGMSEIKDLFHGSRTNVVELKPKKVFSYGELREILPVIIRITKSYSERVNKLVNRLEMISQQDELTSKIEKEINDIILEWQTKAEKLGALTKGLWIADFDSGDGYFCWKYPEEQILYWHGYRDGFSGRRPIKEYLDKKSLNSSSDHENLLSPNKHDYSSL